MNCSAKTKASKYTSSTKVSCKNYNTGNNFWNLPVHYYIVFDFDFTWRDDFRVGVIDWMDCYSPSSTKKSWMEASTLCRHAGGTLPVIRSKDELEELISLLKFGNGLPPIAFIFLGLQMNFKVGNINLYFISCKFAANRKNTLSQVWDHLKNILSGNTFNKSHSFIL